MKQKKDEPTPNLYGVKTGWKHELTMFISLTLVAALMARRLRVPTVVLQMPATVPMVPGGSLYYTIYYVFAGNMPTAKSYFFFTARAVFGMAIGFAVVSVLFKTIDARKTAR